MQIGKSLINDRLYLSKLSGKFCIPFLPMKFAIFLKNSLLFNSLYFLLQFISKTLRLNNLKTETAMNAKISTFEVIIYLILYNLHDCTFNIT